MEYLDILKFAILNIFLTRISNGQLFSGDPCLAQSGLSGICRPIDSCPYALKEVRNGGRPTTCSFIGNEPIVCCPISNSHRPTKPSRGPGEAAKYWCSYYEHFCPAYAGSAAGGVKSIEYEFPHMAAIGYGPNRDIIWNCGGSLISKRYVLTAAHCLQSQNGPARWVLLGSVSLQETDVWMPYARKKQIHPVIIRIPHPGYRPPARYNDIALLKIGPAPEYDDMSTLHPLVHPACLPTDNDYNRRSAIATGWGKLGYGEEPSPDLMKVDLNMLDNILCNETFDLEIRTTKLLRRGIDNSMLCAGVLEGGKDTCQGDSGGPLQVVKKKECLYSILGVTSFGKVCAFANTPSVYTNVYEYIPWIESIVWP